jgi:predicted xylose isomerase-like sugar epimerase
VRRNLSEQRSLVDVTIGIDEGHSRYYVDTDRSSKSRIDKEARCVGAETIVLAPRFSVSHAVARRKVRREVINALGRCDRGFDLSSVEQIEFLGFGCADLVSGGLEERE